MAYLALSVRFLSRLKNIVIIRGSSASASSSTRATMLMAATAAAALSRHFTSSAHHALLLRALFILSLLLAPPGPSWLFPPSPAETLPRYSLTATADFPLPYFLSNSPQWGMVQEFVANMPSGFNENTNWSIPWKDCRDWEWRETDGLICDSSSLVTAIFISNLYDPIPTVLWKLTTLERLSLIWGPNTDPLLSPAISDLTRLTSLSLMRAQLGTTVPSGILTLTGLNTLSLRDVGLTGAIAPEISKLTRLNDLDLSYNSLAGPLPTVLCIPTLTSLALTVNLFTSIPAAVSVMKSLKSLRLDRNRLSGSIPPQISVMKDLYNLELQDNALTGPIPAQLSAFRSLNYLRLQLNKLTGSIPTFPPLMKTINLMSNQLDGSVPKSIASQKYLQQLNLDNNRLTGSVPVGFSASIERISLRNNRLSGKIPPSFFKESQAAQKVAGNNVQAAQVITIQALGDLTYLDLSSNSLEGNIPDQISELTKLWVLDLSSNSLDGTIPNKMSTVSQLMTLDLGSNSFSGSIPDWISTLAYLTTLDLSYNSLNGTIPSGVGEIPYLNVMDLSNNQLSGSIPDSLSRLRYMTMLDLSSNLLDGTIPDKISELQQLSVLDLSNNRLSGSVPHGLTGLTQLTVLSLRNNQLSGCLLQPIPPSVKQYQLDSNFFSCGFSSPPDCTNTIIAVQANCLGTADVPPCPMDPQRVTEVCASFCGLSATSLPCAGHGTCFYSGPNKIPTCACNTGYTNGELPGTCVAVVAAGPTPADFSLLTSISVSSGDGGGAAMAVKGAAAAQPDNSVVLTSNSQAAWGAAFLVSRVRLFSYTVKNHSCGREIGLKLSFSFSLAPATGSNNVGKGGLAFVIAAADAVPGGDGSTLGYSGMSERSIAVEFDTFQDASSSDPDSSHVGINVGGSVVSISTAAVPGLNTGSTKYTWIDYSPMKGGLLSVYVASAASRPAKPTLKRSVSLCDVLKPTFEQATFVVGFTAASSDPPQKQTVLQWSLDTDFPTQDTVTALPLGFTLAEATFTTSGVNRFFRYASAGALQPSSSSGGAPGASTADEEQQWAVATNMTWVRADLLPSWSVPSQGGCGDCWAYAVVASIEAAYAILASNGSLPVFSVDSLVADMKADCSGGSPSKAFQYLLSVSKRGGGLEVQQTGGGAARVKKGGAKGATGVAVAVGSGAVGLQGKQGKQGALTSAAAAAAAAGQSPLCSPLLKPIAALFGINCTPPKQTTKPTVVRPGYSITGFERAAFYSWFGLVLAVQRQPVVVHIEASADSFLNYDGLCKYQDPACFTYNLNHVVLLVGYRLVGFDEAFPHMSPPYWIIRNSWGPDWGDGGYMRMDIQGGNGVCGINTLPGVYPIVLDKQDPCNNRAHHDTIGAVLNPCGNFKCTVTADGTSNRCDCNTASDGRFIEANNTDGSRTCAYVDACAAQIRNPCAVGTCVNDGAGSYSCVCPLGFRQGTTVDGTFSCAPGSTNGTYTVISNNVKCSDVFPIYGLSLEQLKQQNPSIACDAPLPVGTVLQVAPPTTITPCTVYYTTEEGDTCEALATYFSLASTCPSSECTAAFQALNPGVDCTANSAKLPPSQAVCVERRAEMVGVVALCSQYYYVESAETCESIRNVPDPPLSHVDFYRLNPGIKCSRLVPKTDVGTFTGFEACVGSTDSLLQGTCPRATAITIGTGDRCTAIQVKYFRG
ncbi:unnamed protein product [Closterium sp. Yama58-4]|nr:unnamed protein product [Closterium sp. Yama58-4]